MVLRAPCQWTNSPEGKEQQSAKEKRSWWRSARSQPPEDAAGYFITSENHVGEVRKVGMIDELRC